jgi:hypothetical protein
MVSMVSSSRPHQWSMRRRRDSRTIVAIGCITLCFVQLRLARVATPSSQSSVSHQSDSESPSPRASSLNLDKEDQGISGADRSKSDVGATESMAACLLVMDDNHWLIEWLAFHYHVLPLRTLVVVQDPHSKTSPMPILERWEKYMNITVWDDRKFIKPWVMRQHDAGKLPQWRMHRFRQQFFYPACLRELKSASSQTFTQWVLMVDTDELVRPNPYYTWQSGQPLELSRPGIVLSSLKEYERHLDRSRHPACLHIPRLQMSSRTMDDGDQKSVQSTLWSRVIVNASHLLTTSWFYHPGKEISTGHEHLDGKNLINVGRIKESNIPSKVGSVHYVLPDVCPVKVQRNETPILIHHYLGTLEQYTSRSDPRDSIPGRRARDKALYQSYKGDVKDTSLAAWLPGFIESVGADEAQRLLHGVGKVQH